MKKNKVKKKKILKNRSEKLHRRKLKSKKKAKVRRRGYIGLTTSQKALSNFYNRYKGYVKISAPPLLSMVNNPEGTIKFINKVKRQFEKEKKVFVVLRNVEEIGYDAIVLLLSILIRFKEKKIGFNGDFPTNPLVSKILENSGFFLYLFKNLNEIDDRYELIKGGICTHAWKKVDSELTDHIISDNTQKIWGKIRRCQGVQRSLIELMHNTNNHAVYEMKGEKHWFLSVQYISHKKKACFSFIDFGVGIFDSLNNKGKDSKWYNWENSLSKLFTFNNNKELLKLILNGELHKTVTGKSYRGKGLPGIYNSFKRNNFNKLHIISNDVFANISTNNFQSLHHNFSGTFVYWEIDNTNINIDGIY